MGKRVKTKTGALPNSAGFPGKDMVKPDGSFTLVVKEGFFSRRAVILGEKITDEKLLDGFRDFSKDDHKYWE